MDSNKYGIKVVDKFKANDFLGWAHVTGVSESMINFKREHVSGTDEYISVTIEDFNFHKVTGHFHTFIRS